MQGLQTIYLIFVQEFQRIHRGTGPGHGGHVKHAMLQRRAADGLGIQDRLLALGGIDDQADLVALQHVHDMGLAFAHLVDAAAL